MKKNHPGISNADIDEFCDSLEIENMRYQQILSCYAIIQNENYHRVQQIEKNPADHEQSEIQLTPSEEEENDEIMETNHKVKRRSPHWTEEETKVLTDSLRKYGFNWRKIYSKYKNLWKQNGRSYKAIQDRWRTIKSKPEYRDILSAKGDAPK